MLLTFMTITLNNLNQTIKKVDGKVDNNEQNRQNDFNQLTSRIDSLYEIIMSILRDTDDIQDTSKETNYILKKIVKKEVGRL